MKANKGVTIIPYIKQNLRDGLESHILDLASAIKAISNTNDALCGNLNYTIFKIVKILIDKNNGGELSYARFNSIIGALECCKNEITRRLISPYEDQKIEENGDVL